MKILLLFIFVCVWPLSTKATEVSYNASLVKAAYIKNFLSFITWPKPIENHYKICILGDDVIGSALALVVEEEGLHMIDVVKIIHPSPVNHCHAVFIGSANEKWMAFRLEKLKNIPVLTISDIKGFIDKGGMIGLIFVGSKIKFEINLTALKNVGMEPSVHLLEVAHRVKK